MADLSTDCGGIKSPNPRKNTQNKIVNGPPTISFSESCTACTESWP